MIVAQTASATDKLLVIETADGSKTVFALSANPELTFSGQTMLLNVGAQSHSFEIADVAQYYFEDDVTAIDKLGAVKLRLRHAGNNKIIVEGLSPTSDVRLYSVDGSQMPVITTVADGKAIISLSSLPKGIYIISANKNQNIKIYKK